MNKSWGWYLIQLKDGKLKCDLEETWLVYQKLCLNHHYCPICRKFVVAAFKQSKELEKISLVWFDNCFAFSVYLILLPATEWEDIWFQLQNNASTDLFFVVFFFVVFFMCIAAIHVCVAVLCVFRLFNLPSSNRMRKIFGFSCETMLVQIYFKDISDIKVERLKFRSMKTSKWVNILY